MIKIFIYKIINKLFNIYFSIKNKNAYANINRGINFEVGEELKIIGSQYIAIGDNFYAGSGCRIEAWDNYNDVKFSPKIIIGNNVRINSKCHIGAINKIVIGNDVLFGSNVFITDHSHGKITYSEIDIPPTKRDLFSKGEVIIDDKCWICENVTILPGVHIGYASIIGANSVVTKDVPPCSVVGGNPAKVLKQL